MLIITEVATNVNRVCNANDRRQPTALHARRARRTRQADVFTFLHHNWLMSLERTRLLGNCSYLCTALEGAVM